MNHKPEYILCSAIWYPDFVGKDTNPQCVRQSLPWNVPTGLVLCGRNHIQPIRTMNVLSGLPQHESGKWEDGFLTSYDRFVGREEALQIAIASGQIEAGRYSKTELFSEDLFTTNGPQFRVAKA